ncbi:MAG: glycosyltransferase family 9 protein [Alphaproteobacteria bacterium]|nr:glycosyltransferase family 9 protein [Alphaproteobacteria bacterium]
MPAPSDSSKILVIKLGALGDFIQALGPIKAIRAHHPRAHITLLTTPPFVDLAVQSPYFDAVRVDTRPRWNNLRGWFRLRKWLIAQGFSRIYDLQNNDRTSFYLRLFPARSRPEWVGAAPGASHRNAAPGRTAGQALDGHVQTLALAGISDVRADTLEWMEADLKNFPFHTPYILLVPGASPAHPAKRWPAKHYAALAKKLDEIGYCVLVIGGNNENDAAASIRTRCPRAVDLTGQTSLTQIAVLARGAAGAVGNDTGPMHLIAATGCSCLSLFSGLGNPLKHGPKGKNIKILQKSALADLTVEEVQTAFSDVLNQKAAS